MSLDNIKQLNEMHLDVLREIGNIGQGNSASALSQMLSIPIDITVPNVRLLEFDQVVGYLGGPENIVLGMLVGLSGDIQGMMLCIIQENFANKMLQAVLGMQIDNLLSLDDMGKSFIQEIGNILSGSYVNAISLLTGLTIDISVPTISVDMAGAILAVPAVEFAQIGDKVLFIDDSFIIGEDQVKSNMILIPELHSLETLFNRLGVDV